MPTSSDYPVLSRLLSSNAQWAKDVGAADSTFFSESAKGQSPKVLWIGCADSRVPESVVLAAKPGDIFVHRNIANQFHCHDDSALSVLAYAVDVLKVEHVIVVGHTACGGAAYCLSNARAPQQNGHGHHNHKTVPLERWLNPLTELVRSLPVSAPTVPDAAALPVIIEENVKMQVANVTRTQTISDAWASGKSVHVHGWIYLVEEGRLKDLNITRGPASR
ncbi:carbonic anhydrase [Hysterangium stoloniferum]|nr:carbonic anhydrase [Hysterangium stoloniferum]